MAEDFFCTVRPSAWTSGGSWAMAVCTRLLTATTSLSGSVPCAKLTSKL